MGKGNFTKRKRRQKVLKRFFLFRNLATVSHFQIRQNNSFKFFPPYQQCCQYHVIVGFVLFFELFANSKVKRRRHKMTSLLQKKFFQFAYIYEVITFLPKNTSFKKGKKLSKENDANKFRNDSSCP